MDSDTYVDWKAPYRRPKFCLDRITYSTLRPGWYSGAARLPALIPPPGIHLPQLITLLFTIMVQRESCRVYLPHGRVVLQKHHNVQQVPLQNTSLRPSQAIQRGIFMMMAMTRRHFLQRDWKIAPLCSTVLEGWDAVPFRDLSGAGNNAICQRVTAWCGGCRAHFRLDHLK